MSKTIAQYCVFLCEQIFTRLFRQPYLAGSDHLYSRCICRLYTRYVSHNREEYTLEMSARLLRPRIEVHNVELPIPRFDKFRGCWWQAHNKRRHVYVHDFLLARICQEKIMLLALKVLPWYTMLLFVNFLRFTYA